MHSSTTLLPSHRRDTIHAANADSGTTGNFIAFKDSHLLSNVIPTKDGITVYMPNGTSIKSTHTGILDLPDIPISARRAHIFDDSDLTAGSLLSIGLLCDAGLQVVYDKHHVKVYNDQKVVLQGYRDYISKLWMFDICHEPEEQQHHFTASVNTQADRVAFWHAALGSPTLPTWLKAMKKKFMDLPGITRDMIMRHPPNSTATAKGHLDRTRQGQRSTKPQSEYDDTAFPITILTKSHATTTVLTKVWAMTGQEYTDITGRLPVASYSGKQYIMIMYNEDSNYIHAIPMASRKASNFVAAYAAGVEFFTRHGFTPRFERLDNETSDALSKYCESKNIVIQYVPPHNHRANKAERSIRTFKNHFIAMLCTTHPDFPLQAWEHLIPQAELTINLLRASNTAPEKSAWEVVHNRRYDFDRYPIAPIGTKVIAFEGPDQRGSWAPHGVEGYYVGPALLHYRCYTVFIPATASTRVVDTLSWHPVTIPMPTVNANELLEHAITLLQSAVTAMQFPKQSINTEAINNALHVLASLTAPPKEQLMMEEQEHQRVEEHEHQRVEEQEHQRVEEQESVKVQEQEYQRVNKQEHQRVDEQQQQSMEERTHNTSKVNNDVATPPPGFQKHPTKQRPNATITYAEYIKRRKYKYKTTTPRPPAPTSTNFEPIINKEPQSIPPRRTSRQRQPNRQYINAMIAKADEISPNATLADSGQPRPETSTTYHAALKGPDSHLWEKAACDEIDRLIASGTGRFIHMNDKPANRIASYYNPQIRIKTKDDGTKEYRVRGTYGGDRSDYNGPVSAATAALPTIKLLLNAVVSEDASWMTADIKDFYLGTPLPIKEYMRISLNHIPLPAQIQHNIQHYARRGYVMMEISKGIYGLPQAGKLAQDRLFAHLAQHGYHQTPHTPCLFRHETRPIAFTLVVDDFGIKYKRVEDAQHLINTLEQLYVMKVNWTGIKYVGLTIQHNKSARTISISMPGYVDNALSRFGITSSKGAKSPSEYIPPRYGKQDQLTEFDNSPTIPEERKKRIQQIVGVFLFYARAVDPTMLVSVTKLSSMQATPTEDVAHAAERLLHYAATHSKASIVFHASDMRLVCHTDASYLSESGARSRAGGVLFLGTYDNDTAVNGSIECMSSIIPVTVSSAAEAEYGAAFAVAKEAEGHRLTLLDLGYPQSATLIICDNKCAVGLANDSVKQKRSKAIDMRFHWLRDRVKQNHFEVIWREGKHNIADYLTKIHPTKHFQDMRRYFVQDYSFKNQVIPVDNVNKCANLSDDVKSLRGCVDIA